MICVVLPLIISVTLNSVGYRDYVNILVISNNGRYFVVAIRLLSDLKFCGYSLRRVLVV